jgi:prepilin-type processing-associated H-X9-DG protein
MSYGASSAHPGGANVLFGDGSVKFVKNSISYQTWWALGTRAGNEVISADAY